MYSSLHCHTDCELSTSVFVEMVLFECVLLSTRGQYLNIHLGNYAEKGIASRT